MCAIGRVMNRQKHGVGLLSKSGFIKGEKLTQYFWWIAHRSQTSRKVKLTEVKVLCSLEGLQHVQDFVRLESVQIE